MSLARTQSDFLAAILATDEPDDPRLAIYHRGVRGARRGALATAYPVVERLVGAAWFGEAADRYGDRHPSRSGDLHAYGERFPAFLAGYEHARGLDYLPDVARLEWAVHEAGFAAEGARFDFAALGRVAPEALGGLRIRLRPCVRLVASPHPILAIWEANQAGRDGTPAHIPGAQAVLVRRVDMAVVPVAIAPGPWALLEAFAGGLGLDEAAVACQRAGAALEPALRKLAELETLGGFELG